MIIIYKVKDFDTMLVTGLSTFHDVYTQLTKDLPRSTVMTYDNIYIRDVNALYAVFPAPSIMFMRRLTQSVFFPVLEILNTNHNKMFISRSKPEYIINTETSALTASVKGYIVSISDDIDETILYKKQQTIVVNVEPPFVYIDISIFLQ